MLAATDRRLLLDVLAPPEDYALDQAIGTTYTLDLLALLRVPLAATALPWSTQDGRPVENPFALLTALRRNASRISLYCHAGATKVPARHVPLLAFLEDAVHPVTPPRPEGVFHPKVWLVRFAPIIEGDPVLYRLLVLSRNLTFDRSWDVALALDGELRRGTRGRSANRPLSALISSLPGMARAAGHHLSEEAARRAQLLAEEVRRVDWSLPEGFDEIAFHAIGHDGRSSWPIADLYRLMVIVPFVEDGALERLRQEVRESLSIVGRFDELLKLDPSMTSEFEVDVFDDPAAFLDVEDAGPPDEGSDASAGQVELSRLHAKVYVGERARRAAVYVGSANATRAAFERNVELLVELGGARSQHGVEAVRQALLDAGLLTPFKSDESHEPDEALESLERALDRAAHALAAGGLRARVSGVGNGRWRMTLHRGSRSVALDGLRLEARPLSDQTPRHVDLNAEPCCTFPPTGLSSVTPFFALRLSGRVEGTERRLDVTARLPLDGAPSGRAEAVTAELLSDRERLLRFVLLLLADDAQVDRTLDQLSGLLEETVVGGPGAPRDGAIGLPLLEPMLRALHRAPERLDEIDRLLDDIRTAGGSTTNVLPTELEDLWATLAVVRRERR